VTIPGRYPDRVGNILRSHFLEPYGEPVDASIVGAGHKQGELVAAVAGKEIATATHYCLPRGRDLAEQDISGSVSLVIIDS